MLDPSLNTTVVKNKEISLEDEKKTGRKQGSMYVLYKQSRRIYLMPCKIIMNKNAFTDVTFTIVLALNKTLVCKTKLIWNKKAFQSNANRPLLTTSKWRPEVGPFIRGQGTLYREWGQGQGPVRGGGLESEPCTEVWSWSPVQGHRLPCEPNNRQKWLKTLPSRLRTVKIHSHSHTHTHTHNPVSLQFKDNLAEWVHRYL